MERLILKAVRSLRAHSIPAANAWGAMRYSSETTPTQGPSPFMQQAASRSVDVTSPCVSVRGKECSSHHEAQTSLLDFLNRSDILKRRTNIHIPYFTSGSYISVTKSDPHSPSGESTFAGICISTRKCNEVGSTFVLRNIINGIGVEVMYELYSPAIKEIKVLKLERRRRAKLYYLRDKPLKYSTVNEKMEPVEPPKGPVPVHRRRGKPA